MENTIQNARTLFEMKAYDDAFTMATALIDDNQDRDILKEALLIAATSLLIKTPLFPIPEDVIDTAMNAYTTFCNVCENMDEILRGEAEMLKALDIWTMGVVESSLKYLEENPSFDTYQLVLRVKATSLMKKSLVEIASMNCNAAEEAKKAHGFENGGELRKSLNYERVSYLDEEKLAALRYNTAENLFNRANNHVVNGTLSQFNYQTVTTLFVLSELAAQHGAPKKEANMPEMRCKFLKLQARAMSTLLSATIPVNGTRISLYQGNDRQEKCDTIHQLYSEIKTLDYSFVAPVVPGAQILRAPQGGGSSNAGGGCYVATAVYGSYDCPEVWTLRRFRDNTLASTWYGRAFIRTYYAISPTMVKYFGDCNWFKNLFKPTLDKMVASLKSKGVEDTRYEDKNW